MFSVFVVGWVVMAWLNCDGDFSTDQYIQIALVCAVTLVALAIEAHGNKVTK